ncbi:MAG: hypothetical protein GXP42_15180 [Chloroflexi bacterium]|nr:hypothetical protein [Chloroflexota bacterium]
MKRKSRFLMAIGCALLAFLLLGTVALAESPVMPEEAEAVFAGEVEVKPDEVVGVWVIAGRDVIVTSQTRILPSPDEVQVGDVVRVEGKPREDGFYARVILKADSRPSHLRVVHGKIEAMSDAQWTIGGRVVLIDENTRLTGDEPDVGDWAVAKVEKTEAGLLAKSILVKDWRLDEREVKLRGVVQAIDNDVWTVETADRLVMVYVTDATRIIGDPVVGDKVGVKGYAREDGSVLARLIVKLGQRDERLAFAGFVTEIMATPEVLPPTWVWKVERPAFEGHEAAMWLVMVTEDTRTNVPPNEVQLGDWVKGWGVSASVAEDMILAKAAFVTRPPLVRFSGETLATPDPPDYPLGVWQIGEYVVHVGEDARIVGEPPQVGEQAGGYGSLRPDGGIDARLLAKLAVTP